MSTPELDPKRYKRLFNERAAGLKLFAEWEKKQTHKMTVAQALAAIGAIYDMIPRESRKKDFDAKVKGIIAMRRALAVIK
ncbi:hypothetical protein JXM67_08390 [candidate division WOR-3 bacterium]|nr:hypothetical protein [candidate division WOR-3 bacterium]